MHKLPLLMLLATGPFLYSQIPAIHSVEIFDTLVPRFEKLEAIIDLSAVYDNPYDYDEVHVSALFQAPDGRSFQIDGFYMQDFILNETNGELIPIGTAGKFKIRFSPDMVGNWTFSLKLSDRTGSFTSETYSFTCSESPHAGFVRSSQTNYLQFDNQQQYIPVGENMAWPNGNAFLDYTSWLTALSSNGGNFLRLWHAHWGLGIEWNKGTGGFQGLRRYHESNMRYQDWLFDYCADRGLYVMLCLQHHGQVSTQVDPNWHDNPYNSSNGGPAAVTWEFFTHPEAISHTKNRLRYIVARWGYSRAIMAWELFNEVAWTDRFADYQTEVAQWHTDMAAFLKSIDPYQHIITTSYADERFDPIVWANPDIELTQTHFYLNTPHLERALVSAINNYLEDYGKPTLTGEFGLGGSGSVSQSDPDGIHVHNALWATLFGGAAGSAMSWWWDSYIHPRDLYYHFAAVSRMADQIPFLDQDYRPADAYVRGATGDLVLTPTLGWAGRGEDTITVTAAGELIPDDADLGIYLYGAVWNTQHRSPPTFLVEYPQAGTFSVSTNTEAAAGPRITIYLNGEEVLNEAAAASQTYTIDVPAGAATITVDNTGRDWITIASYTFSGLGSQVDSYVLKATAATGSAAAGWVLNNRYNHRSIAGTGEPEAVETATLIIAGMDEGTYAVSWYDCLSGELFLTKTAFAEQQELRMEIPTLYWDLAFRAESDPALSIRPVRPPLVFEVYPNPAVAGADINIIVPQMDSAVRDTYLSLFDGSGKPLVSERSTSTHSQLRLSPDLPNGLYWLHIEHDGRHATRPIVVTQ